jgi:hypothetical protein
LRVGTCRTRGVDTKDGHQARATRARISDASFGSVFETVGD